MNMFTGSVNQVGRRGVFTIPKDRGCPKALQGGALLRKVGLREKAVERSIRFISMEEEGTSGLGSLA